MATDNIINANSRENILHSFASYNCLFTLSGLRMDVIQSKAFLKLPVENVIARSSGIGGTQELFSKIRFRDPSNIPLKQGTTPGPFQARRDRREYSNNILKQGYDIFFENVNITSLPSCNNDRNLSDFVRMEFELHEPFGVTLIEKLRAVAQLSGFKDYQGAPFLLTIEFKGFDENGQDVVVFNKGAVQRKIPLMFTTVDFDVNEGGAIYNCTAVPFHDQAHDDSIKNTRSTITTNCNTLTSWINSVERGMQKQMEDEVKDDRRTKGFEDKYFFKIQPELKKLIKDELAVIDRGIFQTGSVADVIKENNKKQKEIKEITIGSANDSAAEFADPDLVGTKVNVQTGIQRARDGVIVPNTSLVKAYEDIIRSTVYFQLLVEDFWVTYLSGIKGKSLTDDEANKILRSPEISEIVVKHPTVPWFKIKVDTHTPEGEVDPITKMQPRVFTYHAQLHEISIFKMLMAGQSLGKFDFLNKVNRAYNYVFTGKNKDIQNLRVNYKTAYFMRSVRSENKTATEDGLLQKIQNGVRKFVSGPDDESKDILPLRQYPSILKGKSSSGFITPTTSRAQEFFDYLTNPQADMLKIEMEILGDPAYLAQDQFTPPGLTEADLAKVPGRVGESFTEEYNCFNFDQVMPTVALNYAFPTDINENQGLSFFDGQSIAQNTFFTGGYSVYKVESSMNQGSFTQTLHMVRYNNQEGEGKTIKIDKFPLANGSKEKNNDKVTKPIEDILGKDFGVVGPNNPYGEGAG